MKRILTNNIFIIGITFLLPGIIALITKDSFSTYKNLVQPKLSPPSILFPIIWSVLYLLMSIAFILVKENDSNIKIYYVQLILNSLWTLIFFDFKLYFVAFIELIILLFAVLYMTYKFYKDNNKTVYLLLPYIAWTIFASYLNYFIASYN